MKRSRRLALTVLLAVLASPLALAAQPVFTHAVHLEQGLECATCHLPDGGENPTRPEMTVCLDCHGEGEVALPGPAMKRSSLGGEREWIFSHELHVGAGVGCESCHSVTGLQKGKPLAISMSLCTNCHGELGLELPCSSCHTKAREDAPPGPWASPNLDHTASWKMRHGQLSRFSVEKCEYCHRVPDDCQSCHVDKEPTSHTRLFKVKTHGIEAEVDRDVCSTCHIQADFCEACHRDVTPTSHNAAWGNPTNNHCYQCHEPVSDAVCGTCHQDVFAHQTTPPADHTPSWGEPTNVHCQSCHLPLADNTCIVCHKDLAAHEEPPSSHVPSWGDPVNVHCQSCHLPLADEPCAVCHQDLTAHEMAPGSHNAQWGQPNNNHCQSCHLPLADTDCAVCHQDVAAHEIEAPANTHNGSWGNPVNTHCQSCHIPLASTDCAVCHQDLASHQMPPASHNGTWTTEHCGQCHFPVAAEDSCNACHFREPDHPSATMMPSWHSPDFICLDCHGVSAPPPPHPVPMEDCTRCHLPS